MHYRKIGDLSIDRSIKDTFRHTTIRLIDGSNKTMVEWFRKRIRDRY